MRALSLFLVLLVGLLAAGCRDGDAEPLRYRDGDDRAEADDHAYESGSDHPFIGSWTYTTYVSPSEIARISDDPIPPGVEIDLTGDGAATYHANGRYDSSAEFTIRVRQAGEEVPLRFLRRDAGEWEVHDDVLYETVSSGTLTALDPTSQEFLDGTPEFAAFLSPIQGETASTMIHALTPTSIDLQEQESGLRFTLRRDE